jgi:hypothetical protein
MSLFSSRRTDNSDGLPTSSESSPSTIVKRDDQGGTSFTSVTVTSPPVNLTDAATKEYVDNASAGIIGIATSDSIPDTLVKRDGAASSAFAKVSISNAPVSGTDAANKAYVDNFMQGMIWKEGCDYKTVAPLPAYTKSGVQPGVTYTANANGVLVVDSMTPNTGDRILLDQTITDPMDGGIFTVSNPGSASTPWVLTRALDAYTLKQGTSTHLRSGASAGGSAYVLTNETVLVGADAQSWVKLTDSGTSANIANSLVMRGALGEFSAGTVTVDTVQCTGAASANSITTNGITVGNADQPGSLAVSGNATAYNYTPATDTIPQSSPFLLLKGKIYNTTLPNSRYMTGGIQVNSVTQNTDPTTQVDRSLVAQLPATHARGLLPLAVDRSRLLLAFECCLSHPIARFQCSLSMPAFKRSLSTPAFGNIRYCHA